MLSFTVCPRSLSHTHRVEILQELFWDGHACTLEGLSNHSGTTLVHWGMKIHEHISSICVWGRDHLLGSQGNTKGTGSRVTELGAGQRNNVPIHHHWLCHHLIFLCLRYFWKQPIHIQALIQPLLESQGSELALSDFYPRFPLWRVAVDDGEYLRVFLSHCQTTVIIMIRMYNNNSSTVW